MKSQAQHIDPLLDNWKTNWETSYLSAITDTPNKLRVAGETPQTNRLFNVTSGLEYELSYTQSENNSVSFSIEESDNGTSWQNVVSNASSNGTQTVSFIPSASFLKVSFEASAGFKLQNVSLNGELFDTLVVAKMLGGTGYRYGFNGMEKDDEVKGTGNHYDLGLRNYDPRLGRMFIIDPRANEYPWQTTYAYHRNSPIMTIDFLGGGDADGIYIDEETGEVLGEDEFGADDGLVHYTSKENQDKNRIYAEKSNRLKQGGISKTVNIYNEVANELERSKGVSIKGIKLTELNDEVGLGIDLIISMITTAAESTINTPIKYPDPKAVTEAANKSLRSISNTAQKFALFYTVTDKGIKMYNYVANEKYSQAFQQGTILAGYVVASTMMGTPSPYFATQIAGLVVLVGTTIYDIATDK